MNIEKMSGYKIYQFFFWIITIFFILWLNNESFLSRFTISHLNDFSKIAEYGILAFFILIYYLIGKFRAYRIMEEVPSVLPKSTLKIINDFPKIFINVFEKFRNHDSSKIKLFLKYFFDKSDSLFHIIKYSLKTILVLSLFFFSQSILHNFLNNTLTILFGVLFFIVFSINITILARQMILNKLSKLKILFTLSFSFIYSFFTFYDSSILQNKSWCSIFLAFISYFVLISPFMYLIIMIWSNFRNILLSDYTLAKQHKLYVENIEIVKHFYSSNNLDNSTLDELKLFKEVSEFKDTFTNKKEFKLFLSSHLKNENNSKNTHIINEIDKHLENFLIPVTILKNVRADEIKRRNKVNLRTSFYFTLSFFIIYIIIFPLSFILEKKMYYHNFLTIVIFLVFFRLLLRSAEICISFYSDIHVQQNDKKSSLDKKERSELAIKSLLEIIFLSFIILFCMSSLSEKSLYFQFKYDSKLLFSRYSVDSIILFTIEESKKVIKIFMYTLSVSFFNISFSNFGDFYDGKRILLKLVHLIQVISSLVLLTICLSSYINANAIHKKINVILIGNLFYLVETSGYDETKYTYVCTKGFKTIAELRKNINRLFFRKEIQSEEHELYMKAIDSFILK